MSQSKNVNIKKYKTENKNVLIYYEIVDYPTCDCTLGPCDFFLLNKANGASVVA